MGVGDAIADADVIVNVVCCGVAVVAVTAVGTGDTVTAVAVIDADSGRSVDAGSE